MCASRLKHVASTVGPKIKTLRDNDNAKPIFQTKDALFNALTFYSFKISTRKRVSMQMHL